ncbi:TIGR04222 domain-containing membrane protein [Candidatus Berkiella aquae]|uniref:TIGR04222 domain-containing membrane protein n=1 Tax=Candidatus Berkiella aquae TaxID=295108 RepID=A0A0Q9YD18_9GAMM|nr:TIGR04222 domain-containing membrane protein [Candidatus Berkiella aquae]MCS5709887.1 TIGR04222 domain-containing membrane protein [Candidatus Berkiella aquae]
MFNPLNFTGPEFLIFYFVLGSVTLFIVNKIIRKHEIPRNPPKIVLDDPYEIAILRDGEDEALKIATISLISRGLLVLTDDKLQTQNEEAIAHARRDIEKAILTKFLKQGTLKSIEGDLNLHGACLHYRFSLQDLKLVPASSDYSYRMKWIIISGLLLGGLALAKLGIALSRGYTNVEFLILLASGFLYFLYKMYGHERTALGDQTIEDLKCLFMGLQARSSWIKSDGKTNEIALLAAVFGIAALSARNFPFISSFLPKPSSSSLDVDFSCSSSCGSGCGGGCGGCGS